MRLRCSLARAPGCLTRWSDGGGQQRIVAKLEQLLGQCAALETRIRESRRLVQPLPQTALREALAPPAGAVAAAEHAPEAAAARRGRPRKPVFQEGQQMDFDGLLFE
ncbi:hypothetical protein SAMN02745146_2944 [Hymenobacter daecheongensis DSM 21074]|uniref:Uncharacterized protein n=1 Tax=Hymenobacter daecheongensis DSM 21074 TaxID=1121955 RepID=A0A1M6IR96_9BACT|nr:hypothetical protein [Hymenobacter daecheongensis]SHJ37016.1 hypothetical protein SAMN02745146_2944 [Hymenobacter daecheongensis DSM 21074]